MTDTISRQDQSGFSASYKAAKLWHQSRGTTLAKGNKQGPAICSNDLKTQNQFLNGISTTLRTNKGIYDFNDEASKLCIMSHFCNGIRLKDLPVILVAPC